MGKACGVEQRRVRRGGQRRPRTIVDERSVNGAASTAATRAFSLLCLLGAANATDPGIPSDYTVVHANVVARHGERSRLAKSTALEFGDNDGVVLTQQGEVDMYSLGAQLRERYMPISGFENVTTQIEGLTLWYDADRVQFESSGYDRTLESATALGFGLYPFGQAEADVGEGTLLYDNQIVVPIHSSDPENDATLIAADKCPVYDDNWNEVYRGDEVQEMQTIATDPIGDNEGFITQVYNQFESGKTANRDPDCWDEALAFYNNKLELHGPYNLWDCARTLFQDGETQAVDYIMEAEIPDEFTVVHPTVVDGWHFLEYLVYFVEDQKYQQSVVGRMIGGLYLTWMYDRMSQVISHIRSGYSDTVGRLPGMHVSTGHYSTLKGIAGALDIGGLEGIPEYGSHFSFELLYNMSADSGDSDFAVRIMYQNSTDRENLYWATMGQIFDGSGSLDLDDALASERDMVTGIMGWDQWEYLMLHQVQGEPAIYTAGQGEWCADCLSTETITCLEVEVKKMTELYEESVTATQDAEADKEAVDDGVGSMHVALVSVFGLILGIGIGLCMKPCLDKFKKSTGGKAGQVAGDRGLEAWRSNGSMNGSFRLGVKNSGAPSRHVMGAISGSKMVAVPTDVGSPEIRGNGNGSVDQYDAEEEGGAHSIPAFAPTSALGEPVPFPHRRQTSGMVTTGVDSNMMTGIDSGDDDGVEGGANGSTSKLLEYD